MGQVGPEPWVGGQLFCGRGAERTCGRALDAFGVLRDFTIPSVSLADHFRFVYQEEAKGREIVVL